MLPWFIWREVLDYLVQVAPQYCLVSKKWFEYCAGRILTLNSAKLSNDILPSNWNKLAETLELDDFSNINWDFLLECRKIKHVSLNFESQWDINFDLLKKTISYLSIHSIRIKLFDDDTVEQSFLILKEVSPKLVCLDMDCDTYNYNVLPFMLYPKVTKFKVYSYYASVCIDVIDQSMPNIKDLSISSFIEFNHMSTGKTIFKNLKILSLSLNWFSFEENEKINDLLSYNFPNLATCHFHDSVKVYSPERISQSMPKLKKLSFCLVTTDDSETAFPIKKLPQLEELSLICERETPEAGGEEDEDNFEVNTTPVGLNLVNMPMLSKKEIQGKVNFIDSNDDFNNFPCNSSK